MVLVSVFIVTLFIIYYLDKKTNKIIYNYIDTESERISNNIVSSVIHKELADYDYQLLQINYDGKNLVYNTSELNKLSNRISNNIQKVLDDIDSSKVKNYYQNNESKKFKHIRNGIVCELSLGSIRNSLLFANVGPTIPIKLVFLSQNNVDLDFKTTEYGINNILVKVYLRVTLHEQITMPISSKRKVIVVEEPLTVNIIRGEIPYLFDKRFDR